MKVFYHHVYEYKKGLRNLILHTTARNQQELIKKRLEKDNIAYIIYPVSEEKINIFFGNSLCIDIITRINKPSLCEFTHEEDFMLGTMLGYGMLHQCERYLTRTEDRELVEEVVG